nr:hypothetical protein [Tanacetum cinerariifolium]
AIKETLTWHINVGVRSVKEIDIKASRIRLFIKGKKHGMMMLVSIDNGPLVYPTVEEDRYTRLKKYSELTKAQQLQDDCDVQATNINLHGLPPDVLYNLFNKFASVQASLSQYKFLNALPPEWSKFVNDVKLAKTLYTTNYDQLYAYLSQHEQHAQEVCVMRERYQDLLAMVANFQTLFNPSQSPQHLVPTMHPPPQQFTPVYAAHIHHQQHRTPINPKKQSISLQPFISLLVTQQPQAEFPKMDFGFHPQTINSECLPILEIRQPFKMEESQFNKFKEDKLRVLLVLEIEELLQPQGEIMPRNFAWFKEKLMLVEAREAGQILDEEQLAFIANPKIEEA